MMIGKGKIKNLAFVILTIFCIILSVFTSINIINDTSKENINRDNVLFVKSNQTNDSLGIHAKWVEHFEYPYAPSLLSNTQFARSSSNGDEVMLIATGGEYNGVNSTLNAFLLNSDGGLLWHESCIRNSTSLAFYGLSGSQNGFKMALSRGMPVLQCRDEISQEGMEMYSDYLIYELDSRGNWTITQTVEQYLHSREIIVDENGSVLDVGSWYGSSIAVNNMSLSPIGAYDVVLVKMNETGYINWVSVIGGKSFEHVEEVIVGKDGSIIVEFLTMSNNVSTFNSFQSPSIDVDTIPYSSAVARFSPNGVPEFIWAANGSMRIDDISYADNLVTISGRVESATRMNEACPSTRGNNYHQNNPVILQIDSDGEIINCRVISSITATYGILAGVDDQGTIWLAATFQDMWDQIDSVYLDGVNYSSPNTTFTYTSVLMTINEEMDVISAQLFDFQDGVYLYNLHLLSNGSAAIIYLTYSDTVNFNGTNLSFGNSDSIIIAAFNNVRDSDGDGIVDLSDNCPKIANPVQKNLDGDEFGDVCDDDIDGDGAVSDQCPSGMTNWKSNATTDHDRDGCNDESEDLDDDNDSILDIFDICPKGEVGWISTLLTDVNSDGCPDPPPVEEESNTSNESNPENESEKVDPPDHNNGSESNQNDSNISEELVQPPIDENVESEGIIDSAEGLDENNSSSEEPEDVGSNQNPSDSHISSEVKILTAILAILLMVLLFSLRKGD